MATDWQTATEQFLRPAPDQIDPKLVALARLMDEAITIPGTNYRIGLDGLIGLIPVFGDLATGIFAGWMLNEARRLGVPWHKRALISSYYGIDFLIGLVPLFGDVFDFAFKAHKKSLRVIEKHLESQKIYVKAVPVDNVPNSE